MIGHVNSHEFLFAGMRDRHLVLDAVASGSGQRVPPDLPLPSRTAQMARSTTNICAD
jgi:hypothetical protein